jgi:hypothetical protein
MPPDVYIPADRLQTKKVVDLLLIRRYLGWRFGLPGRIVEPVRDDAGRLQTARPLRRRASYGEVLE